MSYDENLLVELITDAELSHGQIAEKVGISRRTVWSIANGHSRPDLQQKIADTVEGYRQAVVRLAAKHMTAVLARHIKEAIEGQGETARKTRDFLLTTFMKTLSAEPAQAVQRQKAKREQQERLDSDMRHERIRQAEEEDRLARANPDYRDDYDEGDDDEGDDEKDRPEDEDNHSKHGRYREDNDPRQDDSRNDETRLQAEPYNADNPTPAPPPTTPAANYNAHPANSRAD
jgi:DNA-binding XRE family transcriptional regulator